MSDTDRSADSSAETSDAKRRVKEFYDNVGWQPSSAGFEDAGRFEDLRPVASEYTRRAHERVSRHLPRAGTYLLDVASGPVQYEEYRAYSAGFTRRVCVDFSVVALRAARDRLRDHGLYVVADVTALPFRSETMDAALSLHTIYHVGQAAQETAIREMLRTVKPGGKAVVIYSWGARAPLVAFLMAPHFAISAWRRVVGRLRRVRTAPGEPVLYFHAHTYRWFETRQWPAPWKLFVWRSASVPFTRAYMHHSLGGRSFLRFLFGLEERWPNLMGRLGQYPMFVFEKPAPAAGAGASPGEMLRRDA